MDYFFNHIQFQKVLFSYILFHALFPPDYIFSEISNVNNPTRAIQQQVVLAKVNEKIFLESSNITDFFFKNKQNDVQINILQWCSLFFVSNLYANDGKSVLESGWYFGYDIFRLSSSFLKFKQKLLSICIWYMTYIHFIRIYDPFCSRVK